MHDQADELRQLVRQRTACGLAAGSGAPLVVVSGGQRNVGTTTISASLAVALARQGRRAVLVDADLEHGGRLLRTQDAGGGVLDVLLGRRSVHEVLQRGPSGIQLIAGSGTTGLPAAILPRAQDRLIADLERLAPHAEVIVIDAGNGRGQFVRQLWRAASSVIVVATPEDAAVMQAYASIKLLLDGDDALRLQTFINRANDGDAAADVQTRIAEACRRFLGVRPRALGRATAGGEPDNTWPVRDALSRDFDQAAETLWTQLQTDTETSRRQQSAPH